MKARKIVIMTILTLFLSGCAGVGHIIPPKPGLGVYHKVKKGETLWRISGYYGVDLERIARINRLPDKRKIYVGQRLFIPDAAKQLGLASPKLLDERSFIWPVKGNVVSFYGTIEDNIKNKGIDIKAKRGDRVVASRSGTVSFCDENMKGFGKTIIIDHGDGFSTIYAHNSRIMVKVGERVMKETVIARVGDTGRAPSPRLHFEIRKNKVPRNPFYYLP